MKIAGEWIEAAHVQQVLHMLTDAGHQAFLVGGCVRNALLGQPVADIDISTDAMPERVVALAGATGLKAVPTGIEHGTITVVAEGVGHEITTFRRDVETDGRRAVVAFSTRIEDDAARRDFTMNALYADATGAVVDPMGGLADLWARRVRFVGDADERIREDLLRILRFFRFHAWYGDPEEGLDADGLAACAANSAGIETLSRERIGHEMRRLLAAPDPSQSVAAMQATGILARVLPGADARALAPLVHLEPPYAPDWIRRLCVLGGTGHADGLRLSRAEARRAETLAAALAAGESAAVTAYRHGAEIARDVVLVMAASAGTEPPAGWEDRVAQGTTAVFPVASGDLMPVFSGAALGARLRELEERWIASGFELSREQLLA
ncbi:CCA tRNA nucleotidyltransferase [Albidovulum sp.]|uniref:CCA tRNA nucleotidyltransferase n=1 Tax=Albidovulum sp. TaxID=1872424 RepID=UPI001E092A35|nr:CCA tRNA nucleotidyltransferase [Paracoccaceae bacterium]MCC0045606.1 CCA tRNA nucleotidyltransferase [Defluviimonas sp.]MCP5355103.1 CCA tRNA nucleotidyltransferase [Paracoccaceae bacterium]